MDNILTESHLRLVRPSRAADPLTEEDLALGWFANESVENLDFKEYVPGNSKDDNKNVLTCDFYENLISIYQPLNKADAKGRVAVDSSGYTAAIRSGLLELEDCVLRMVGTSAYDIYNQAVFQAGSIEDLISQQLSTHVDYSKADLIAVELGKLTRISSKMIGLTIEERAISREIGLRLAGMLANAYLSCPKEVAEFTDTIKSYAQRDEMLDKGYYFWEGQAYESYKPIPISIQWKRWEHGGPRPYSDRDAEAFREKEKEVTEAINIAVASVTDDMVLVELMKLESGNTVQLYPARELVRS